MKNLTLILFFMTPVISFSQPSDSSAIKRASLDYVEGYFQSDAQRVAKAVSPELIKRIVIKDDKGNVMIKNMGASELIFAAAKNTNSNVIKNDAPFHADVFIYDISNDIATVMIKTNKFKFIDYAQLAKIKGEWKIINVLWAFTN